MVTEQEERDGHQLDIADVQRRVKNLQQHLEFCEAVIDTRPGTAGLKLVYEELYFTSTEQRNQQIGAMWQWLGVASLEAEQIQDYLDPEEVKINSTTTYAWLPNAREIEEYCGNAVTGWLYH